jgi:hypothetical protein
VPTDQVGSDLLHHLSGRHAVSIHDRLLLFPIMKMINVGIVQDRTHLFQGRCKRVLAKPVVLNKVIGEGVLTTGSVAYESDEHVCVEKFF